MAWETLQRVLQQFDSKAVVCGMAGIRGKAVKGRSGADAEPGWHVARTSSADRRAGDGKGLSAMSRREVDQALRAFKEAGNTAGCMSVLRGLEDHGVVANVRQYTTLISTMSRHGDWRVALDMLREMERKGVGEYLHIQLADLDVREGKEVGACARA